ncbi:carboxylating nicotinate-nucleotide diphosphorylase [Aquella oligotrophica]|uniref:Probable nicotinate-nucleotide pyrophosphorylase [carboxylating] n=1 Tax=Aquella oligotrophica TaxID=2067065 RepID=A0A2I7N7H7_9NEIS|nr:carboxylating nicotinate-nucleotide diphosphorylase [Aquella oligotrophica]AUR52409.1 nicotinate-nucleotide diphosphorylase (carboxylating) [Aquella oligotrophica]
MNHLLPDYLINKLVAEALAEDLNNTPDWTANLISKDSTAKAIIKTNQDMVICGIQFVETALHQTTPDHKISWLINEGDSIKAGSQLCTIEGNARGLLTAERTALNFLQTLSATATITREYVTAIANLDTQIMDTRKTIPGLRYAQKYAVRVGGGHNQRIGLFDGVLIKENHIIAHGGIDAVLEHAFKITPAHIPIQIEVENFTELKQAVARGARLILLDNMSTAEISECVSYCKDKDVILEVSGNVNLANVKDYALCGVNRISIGSLTKNIQAIDLSMRFI